MHFPTDRTAPTTAFGGPVVDWFIRERGWFNVTEWDIAKMVPIAVYFSEVALYILLNDILAAQDT